MKATADVLVIGAGPAGSAAALVLARAGIDVALIDKCEFPRGKTCGDALLPDAMSALARLGLDAQVLSAGRGIDALRVYAPGGDYVDLRGRFAALPRIVLDDLLRDAAVRAGSRFLAPFKVAGPIASDGGVGGARLIHARTNRELAFEAAFTVLATGAASAPLRSFGLRENTEPTAIALRGYFKVPPALARELGYLCIAYEKHILPAYGWIFPGPDDVYNLGVGYPYGAGGRSTAPHPRALWSTFVEGFQPARRIVRAAKQVAPLRGAPLKTSFDGNDISRPGLLVAGEAAGLTYALTGEGIGKAIESGMLAAEILIEALHGAVPDPRGAAARYETSARGAFRSRMEAYQRAQAWLSFPWILNYVCRHARRDGFARRQLEGMITETAEPRALFSLSGLLRALLG